MTNEEIIELALEVSQSDVWKAYNEELITFARVVEAKTIERCAEVCDELPSIVGGVNRFVTGAVCAAAIRSMK